MTRKRNEDATTPARPLIRYLLGLTGALALAGLVIPSDGCTAALRFKATEFPVFHHALFIRGSGRPADLVDSVGAPIDFASRLANRPGRSRRELQQVLQASRDSAEDRLGVPVRGAANFDYEAYLRGMTRQLRRELRDGRKQNVLLWIHGGRNPLGGGKGRTLQLVSALDSTSYYPICVNWESSDLVSYWSHLTYCRPAHVRWWERAYRALQVPLLLAHDVGRGLARIPLGIYGDLSREATAIRTSGAPLSEQVDSLSYSRGGMRRGIGHILNPLGWAVSLPTRTAVGVLIHTGGPGEWESLRHSTQEMFQTDGDLRTTDRLIPPLEDSGAFSRFAAALSSALQSINARRDSAHQVTVTVVAHSMGAMVACEMLRHHLHLPVRDIVFMAAACQVHDFFDVIVPYLEEHPETRFFNLMLHPVNDLRETFVPVVGEFVYRGSLLTWIDDFLETQESPLERTLGRTENALAATRLVPSEVRSRVMFKTFGDGSADDPSPWPYGTPKRHGDFSNPRLRFWDEGFWTPVVPTPTIGLGGTVPTDPPSDRTTQ